MRKKVVINKKFQLGLTLRMVGLSLASFMIILLMTIAFPGISWFSDTSMQTDELVKAIRTQDAIIKSFIEYSRRSNNSNVTVLADSVAQDHAASMETVKKNLEMLEARSKNSRYLLVTVIAIMFAHMLVMYLYMLRRTNRIYGPIHVMTQYLDDIRKKKTPIIRKLRSGDEFAEFYDAFVAMIRKIRFPEKNNDHVTEQADESQTWDDNKTIQRTGYADNESVGAVLEIVSKQ